MRNNQKDTIDLLRFIKYGDFGSIKIGMSREEILDVFPQPDDWMNGYKMENSPIWRYGNFEMHFNGNDVLYLIYSDYVEELFVGKNLYLNRWIFEIDKKIKFKEIKNELNKEGILFDSIANWGHKAFRIIQSDVTLTFWGEEIISNEGMKVISPFDTQDEEKLFLGSIEKKMI
jgi:hypothetical protein